MDEKLNEVLAFIFFLCLVQASYSLLNVIVQIRPHGEFRNRFKSLSGNNAYYAFFIEQRSLLNIIYKQSKLSVGLALQDVKIWGETAQINKSDGLSSIHEAWREFNLIQNFQ
ncbi:hypothetical protein [Fulvivirga sediminis]|uniref:Uncharacterized protein n=1 Tax=Fulvivirga sediminis TaxID=2803949 RepID=A0A937K000_9BACT|nr:hypothetical protein [Fulvivirga sediminis]MBL3657159.1 hypothetical protein [Fulvivirga sediminis]